MTLPTSYQYTLLIYMTLCWSCKYVCKECFNSHTIRIDFQLHFLESGGVEVLYFSCIELSNASHKTRCPKGVLWCEVLLLLQCSIYIAIYYKNTLSMLQYCIFALLLWWIARVHFCR